MASTTLEVVSAASDGVAWGWKKLGVPGPELARHVLVETRVLLLVKPLERLGVARVQLVPHVSCLEVG